MPRLPGRSDRPIAPPPDHHQVRPRRSPRVLALAAVVLCGILAGCSVSVQHRTGTTSDGNGTTSHGPDTGAGSGTRPKLKWRSCDAHFQCATLTVPVDYDQPDGATLQLALVRHRATNPDKRIGSLVVNPGGPGGSGIDLAESLWLGEDIDARFDLVGFDPRGVGRSTPIECHDNLQELYAADPAPATPAATAHLLAVSKTFVNTCAERYRDLLPHLGTRDVARDLDRIRAALGDEKLTYLGYSYGTSIGQVYADLFPTKVRAVVLDGVVRLGESGLDAATSQAFAFEQALDAFLLDCTKSSSCPLGDNPGATIDRVIARARRKPIPAPGADRPLGPGELQLGVGQALYSKQLWPVLRQALVSADKGDGSGLVALADQYLQRNSDGSYPNGFEVYFAVSCLDWDWPRDPERIFNQGRLVAERAPRLGEGIVTDYVRCAMWPTPPQPLTAPKAVGSPTILVVSTTGDPATPYANGVDLAHALPHGALITYRGEGHTIYGQGNRCVDDKVNTYLMTGKAADESTC